MAPEYLKLWKSLKVTNQAAAERAASLILKFKAAYKEVEALTGVPWFVVGLTHYRESNCSFKRWLHNGDPMRDKDGNPKRTVQEPKNRPPDPSVSWVQGAVDALVNVEHLNTIKTWGPEHVAYGSEKFNGFGYRNPRIDIPSPYLWGGTNAQKRGKYVADGKYDPKAWDTQLGVMAVLKVLMELDPEASRFANVAPSDSESPVGSSASPKATDVPESQLPSLRSSQTIWGGILGWLGGVWGSFTGMFEHLATPWGFATFALLVFVISVALFLVVKGRIDVQKLVKHLSPAAE